jgi:hypothetical protein
MLVCGLLAGAEVLAPTNGSACVPGPNGTVASNAMKVIKQRMYFMSATGSVAEQHKAQVTDFTM